MPRLLIEFPADDTDRARHFWQGLLQTALPSRDPEQGRGWQSSTKGWSSGSTSAAAVPATASPFPTSRSQTSRPPSSVLSNSAERSSIQASAGRSAAIPKARRSDSSDRLANAEDRVAAGRLRRHLLELAHRSVLHRSSAPGSTRSTYPAAPRLDDSRRRGLCAAATRRPVPSSPPAAAGAGPRARRPAERWARPRSAATAAAPARPGASRRGGSPPRRRSRRRATEDAELEHRRVQHRQRTVARALLLGPALETSTRSCVPFAARVRDGIAARRSLRRGRRASRSLRRS